MVSRACATAPSRTQRCDTVDTDMADQSGWREDERVGRSYGGPYRGRGPKGYIRSDERICEDVCDRLSDDPFVDAADVEVVVAGSEVTLTGTRKHFSG